MNFILKYKNLFLRYQMFKMTNLFILIELMKIFKKVINNYLTVFKS